MFKEIFKWVILLITQPGKAWEMLAEKKENNEEFVTKFVYPLIGLVTATAFLGILFTRKEFDVELALKSSIKAFISVFGGFFLASYLLNELWQNMFHRPKDMPLMQRFVGYSSTLMYALTIVLMLIPEFFFLRIFILYTFYMIWEGAKPFLYIEEKERLKFSTIATAVIILIPEVINIALSMLMPGLRF